MGEDKKYWWIKLNKDFFADDSPIDALLGMPNGSDYVCLYLKLCLSTMNKDGRLCNNIGEMLIPYDAEKITRDMKYFSIDTVRVAMEIYQKLGLIYTQEDGVLAISNYENMIGSCKTDVHTRQLGAERQARYRLAHKNDNSVTVTPQVTDEVTLYRNVELRDKSIELRDKSKDIRDKSIELRDNKKKKPATPIVYYPNDELLDDAFKEFIKMRKAIKAPMTDKAIELMIKKIEKLASVDGAFNNDLAIDIINQSVENSWKSVYELKEDHKQKAKQENLLDKWLNA